MKKLLAVILLLLAGAAWADDFNEGNAAYEKKDYPVALAKFKLAAAQGVSEAMSNIGVMYEYGEGVEKNFAEAVRWYKLAAEKGNLAAQYQVGTLYYMGNGVEKNYVEARKWYKLGAEQGDSNAMFGMGTFYDNGFGVEKSNPKAIKWYKLAAKYGNLNAQKRIEFINNKTNPCYKSCQSTLTECVIRYKSAANDVCGMPNLACNRYCDSN
jgi:hypothetical protein